MCQIGMEKAMEKWISTWRNFCQDVVAIDSTCIDSATQNLLKPQLKKKKKKTKSQNLWMRYEVYNI